MKLLLSLLLLCGSAIGQTKAAACIEGDTQGIVITTSPPQYEWNKCVNGKWVRVEPAHNPTASFNPVDVSRLEARIAALEKRVKELEERIAKDGTAQFTPTPPYRDPTQPIYVPRDLGIDPCMGSVADRPEDWACPVGGVLVEKSIEQRRCSNHKEYKCFYPQATGSRR